MSIGRRYLITLAAAAAASGLGGPGHAQQAFPNKPVKIIVQTAAGGNSDLLTRAIADKLTTAWGQQVIVEQKLGANGLIATQSLLQAPADGYTVFMSLSSMVQNLLLQASPGYKLEDLAPVTMVSVFPIAMGSNAAANLNSVEDLLKLAREKPGALSFGSYGVGSGGHLLGAGLNKAAGTQMIHVAYKGEAPSLPDLLSGQLTVTFGSVGFYTPHVNAGKVKMLAVAAPQRLPRFPNLPTFAEAGFPGINLPGWAGMFVKAGTPAPIVNKIAQDVRAALAMPDIQARMATFGFEAVGNSPDEFSQQLKTELVRWGTVVRENNIKLE
jgi:tripartite-type tricarboxylate transporter receptor subunit TctC